MIFNTNRWKLAKYIILSAGYFAMIPSLAFGQSSERTLEIKKLDQEEKLIFASYTTFKLSDKEDNLPAVVGDDFEKNFMISLDSIPSDSAVPSIFFTYKNTGRILTAETCSGNKCQALKVTQKDSSTFLIEQGSQAWKFKVFGDICKAETCKFRAQSWDLKSKTHQARAGDVPLPTELFVLETLHNFLLVNGSTNKTWLKLEKNANTEQLGKMRKTQRLSKAELVFYFDKGIILLNFELDRLVKIMGRQMAVSDSGIGRWKDAKFKNFNTTTSGGEDPNNKHLLVSRDMLITNDFICKLDITKQKITEYAASCESLDARAEEVMSRSSDSVQKTYLLSKSLENYNISTYRGTKLQESIEIKQDRIPLKKDKTKETKIFLLHQDLLVFQDQAFHLITKDRIQSKTLSQKNGPPSDVRQTPLGNVLIRKEQAGSSCQWHLEMRNSKLNSGLKETGFSIPCVKIFDIFETKDHVSITLFNEINKELRSMTYWK